MKFTVLSLFPQLVEAWKATALVEDAIQKRLLEVSVVNPRDYSQDKHKNVDDRVYGGEDGMVMKAEPLAVALESLAKNSGAKPYVVALTPQGKVWQQSDVPRMLEKKHVLLVCGRYAGFDQRFLNDCVDEEISIGDYVLNGGEVAALAVMESVSRFIPGFMSHEDSAAKDSFSSGPFLEPPAFTRPQVWREKNVPAFLVNGDHGARESWLKALAMVQTAHKRPDLMKLWTEEQQSEYQKALQKVMALPPAELKVLGFLK